MQRSYIEQNVSRVTDDQLLGLCGQAQKGSAAKAAFLDEAQRRQLITQEERELCADETIQTRMRKNALLASWGRPEGINSSGGVYGHSEQWVYGLGNYVYLDGDGLVESWQQYR